MANNKSIPPTAVRQEPLAATITDTCQIIGVRRSTIYRLINAGDLEIIKIGKRTLVVIASVQSFIASRQASARNDRAEAA